MTTTWHGGVVTPRLHVVTGKGGTGKTTVAAALAVALAREGGRVLLVEVEERQGISQIMDVPPLGTTEEPVGVGLDGGEVVGLSVEAGASLVEYLRMFYKLGRAGDLLQRIGAIEFATTIAPGLRDVLLGGKVYEAVERRTGRRGAVAHTYDAVVLDAPPTGRVNRFLNVTDHLADLARVGPIRRQSDSVSDLLHSPATVVHVVTLLEQLPVQETADAVAELEGSGLRLGAVVVNQVRSVDAAAELAEGPAPDPHRIAEHLDQVGIRPGPGTLDGLVTTGVEAVERYRLEQDLRAEVVAIGRPVIELEHLSEGVGPDAVRRLAWDLRNQEVQS